MAEIEQTAKIGERLKRLRKERNLSHIGLKKILEEEYGIEISRDSLMNYEVSEEAHCKFGTNLKMRVEYISALADLYGVSTDYLLGKSDIKTTNVTIKGIAEYTGLTELSIDFLHWLASEGNDIYSPRELINELLGRDAFNMNLADALDEFCNGAHDAAQPNKDLMIARGEIPDDMKVSQIEWTAQLSSQELAMLKIEHAKSKIIRILDTIAREHRQTKK